MPEDKSSHSTAQKVWGGGGARSGKINKGNLHKASLQMLAERHSTSWGGETHLHVFILCWWMHATVIKHQESWTENFFYLEQLQIAST